jgi:hypothetical protein
MPAGQEKGMGESNQFELNLDNEEDLLEFKERLKINHQIDVHMKSKECKFF